MRAEAKAEATIDHVKVSAYVVPTATPEVDGTLEWERTTVVVVEAAGGRSVGLGMTYADVGTAALARAGLAEVVVGRDAFDVPAAFAAMVRAVRNVGRPGVASMAIAAIDVALCDLKAKLLDVPLVSLLGAARDRVAVYGSGGFTSYPVEMLTRQLAGWVERGIRCVKMKVGRRREDDLARVAAARRAIGPNAELFVDANGAYARKEALAFAEGFAEQGVTWFEEPVSSDDLDGLRLLRDRAPAGMEIAAGEYGYDLPYFRRMLEAGAVDVLQADATRAAGVTGFMAVGPLAEAHNVPVSAHTAPSLHAHLCCAMGIARHVEYFYDHARIERLLFDGALEPEDGELRPDLSRPGLGLEIKRADAARYAV